MQKQIGAQIDEIIANLKIEDAQVRFEAVEKLYQWTQELDDYQLLFLIKKDIIQIMTTAVLFCLEQFSSKCENTAEGQSLYRGQSQQFIHKDKGIKIIKIKSHYSYMIADLMDILVVNKRGKDLAKEIVATPGLFDLLVSFLSPVHDVKKVYLEALEATIELYTPEDVEKQVKEKDLILHLLLAVVAKHGVKLDEKQNLGASQKNSSQFAHPFKVQFKDTENAPNIINIIKKIQEQLKAYEERHLIDRKVDQEINSIQNSSIKDISQTLSEQISNEINQDKLRNAYLDMSASVLLFQYGNNLQNIHIQIIEQLIKDIFPDRLQRSIKYTNVSNSHRAILEKRLDDASTAVITLGYLFRLASNHVFSDVNIMINNLEKYMNLSEMYPNTDVKNSLQLLLSLAQSAQQDQVVETIDKVVNGPIVANIRIQQNTRQENDVVQILRILDDVITQFRFSQSGQLISSPYQQEQHSVSLSQQHSNDQQQVFLNLLAGDSQSYGGNSLKTDDGSSQYSEILPPYNTTIYKQQGRESQKVNVQKQQVQSEILSLGCFPSIIIDNSQISDESNQPQLFSQQKLLAYPHPTNKTQLQCRSVSPNIDQDNNNNISTNQRFYSPSLQAKHSIDQPQQFTEWLTPFQPLNFIQPQQENNTHPLYNNTQRNGLQKLYQQQLQNQGQPLSQSFSGNQQKPLLIRFDNYIKSPKIYEGCTSSFGGKVIEQKEDKFNELQGKVFVIKHDQQSGVKLNELIYIQIEDENQYKDELIQNIGNNKTLQFQCKIHKQCEGNHIFSLIKLTDPSKYIKQQPSTKQQVCNNMRSNNNSLIIFNNNIDQNKLLNRPLETSERKIGQVLQHQQYSQSMQINQQSSQSDSQQQSSSTSQSSSSSDFVTPYSNSRSNTSPYSNSRSNTSSQDHQLLLDGSQINSQSPQEDNKSSQIAEYGEQEKQSQFEYNTQIEEIYQQKEYQPSTQTIYPISPFDLSPSQSPQLLSDKSQEIQQSIYTNINDYINSSQTKSQKQSNPSSDSSSQQSNDPFHSIWMKKDFVCIETLGKGSFGVVQLMKENRTDKLSAWKEMKYQTHKDKQLVDSEVNIMRNIYKYLSDQASKQNSPFVSIIKPLGGFENKDNDTYVLILEYCSMGDLRKFINETKELINEDRVWNFTGQIASAIHQLHMINIVHKDIKPENILINENFHLKLADFGLSQHLQDNQITLKTDGTPLYMTIELLEALKQQLDLKKFPNQISIKKHISLQQTLATDIWAFGITLCELITQKHPFFEDMKSQHVTLEMLIQKLQQKQLLQIQGSFSDNLKSLVKKMLENKHEDRITAGQIVTIPEIVDILMPKKSNLKQENNIKSKETEEKEKENKQNESE